MPRSPPPAAGRRSRPPSLPVHSAGTTSRHLAENPDIEQRRRVPKANLTGAFIVAQQTAGGMVPIGSRVSATGSGGGAHDASSKAGPEGLTHHLTRELLPNRVPINAILPSAIGAELLRKRYPESADREAVAAQIPAGRPGRPEDIADAAVFLPSDRAPCICGRGLPADGGRTRSR